MKVLVVDEDPNAQKILRALLQQAGHSTLIAPDVATALPLATTGESAPHVIICDWKNSGINAPAFCTELRKHKQRIRPYILILSAKQSKEEIAEGLDAGADAYVTKPFNLVEIQARLRVAIRSIDSQFEAIAELQEETAAATERNKLLGEMLVKQDKAKISNTMQAAAAAVTSVLHTKKKRNPGEFDQYEIRYLTSAALIELKLVLQATKPSLLPPRIQNFEVCAWTAIHCPGIERWVDVVLACSLVDAAKLFEKSLGRPSTSTTETTTFLAELSRILSAAFMRTLQTHDPKTLIPCGPKGIQSRLAKGQVPDTMRYNCHELTVDGHRICLGIDTHECAKLDIPPGEIRELDILAEAFPPPSFTEVPMFKQGTIMNSRFVEKLHEQSELSRFSYNATIHRPSEMSRFFLRA